jgi:hypothetical protein
MKMKLILCINILYRWICLKNFSTTVCYFFVRQLIQAIAMTACDLSASAKPWDVQVKTVKVIFEEFYEQVRTIFIQLYFSCHIFKSSRDLKKCQHVVQLHCSYVCICSFYVVQQDLSVHIREKKILFAQDFRYSKWSLWNFKSSAVLYYAH